MKRYAVLLLPFLLAACQESTGPVDTPNTSSLNVSRANIALSNTQPIDTSIVSLECGCHFTFSVESFTGDTNVIHYSQHDATTTQAYRIALALSADTAALGAHSAALAILCQSPVKGTYRDTIRVNYTRN